MKVGDLVKVIVDNPPFGFRPPSGSVGIVVETKETPWLGVFYYIYIDNVGWRFYKNELEKVDGSR